MAGSESAKVQELSMMCLASTDFACLTGSLRSPGIQLDGRKSEGFICDLELV